MDAFIDTIEWIAAGFVGLVAIDIFASVLLRYFFSVSIPDSDDFGKNLLGIPIFWGIAAVAWLSDVSAVLPIAVRTYRLIFHPADIAESDTLKTVGQTSMRIVTDYTFGVIPMFLLMGAFVSRSGMSREIFRAANTFLGHWQRGPGLATIAACGGFPAISGSSVAIAATFSTVAYPEMRRFNYPQSFATGAIAAGGTLGAMFPPSIVLAVYGPITQQDIGTLFMARIGIIGLLRPHWLPTAPVANWAERFNALKDIWASLALFISVIGGLHGGLFTPTEAGGMGAGGAFPIGLAPQRLTREDIRQALLQATRTAAAMFTVPIGAILFRYFLTVMQTPKN